MRTILFDASGQPVVMEVPESERALALLCEGFGVVFFAGREGAPETMLPEAFLQAVLRVVGKERLQARWPMVGVTPRE